VWVYILTVRGKGKLDDQPNMQFSKILWIRGQLNKIFKRAVQNCYEFDNIEFEEKNFDEHGLKFAVIFSPFSFIFGFEEFKTLFILLTHEENTG